MSIRRFLGIVFLFVFFSLVRSTVLADDLPTVGANLSGYVPPTGAQCSINVPTQYTTIQAAIDAANPGDTICVGPGTYNGNVIINKSIRLSGSGATGESIINGYYDDQVTSYQMTVQISASNAILEGFLINGIGTGYGNFGVWSNNGFFGDIVRYNHIISGNGAATLQLESQQRHDDIIQNNILEGNNAYIIAAFRGGENESILNNTFTGNVAQSGIDDSGVVISVSFINSLVKQNAFNTGGTVYELMLVGYSPNIVTENNFNSITDRKLRFSGGNILSLDAQNNWWGNINPSNNIIGDVNFTPFANAPFLEYPLSTPTPTPTPIPQITGLSPAKIWIGLRNSDDVGIRFDLLAEAYANGSLISSGQLNSVWGGGSGFSNAHLQTISFNSFSPVDFSSGSTLSIKVYARNACSGSGHNSGTARLWYNGLLANSQFDATIGTNESPYYLVNNFLLSTLPGTGPRRSIDVSAGSRCGAFKPFGTWTITP